jgi:mono/diheme cytochrome c family protein
MNIRKCTVGFAGAAGLILSAPVLAHDAGAIARGKTVFELRCAPCHGAETVARGRALPGTDALRIKYQGKLPALIEHRSDLTEPVLKTYLRRGSWSMPPFRKSELSDRDITDIAEYLEESSRKEATK